MDQIHSCSLKKTLLNAKLFVRPLSSFKAEIIKGDVNYTCVSILSFAGFVEAMLWLSTTNVTLPFKTVHRLKFLYFTLCSSLAKQ